MSFDIGSFSHKGMVREQNEDSYAAGNNFAVVADGMGGHKKGEVASKAAVEIIILRLSDIPATSSLPSRCSAPESNVENPSVPLYMHKARTTAAL